MSKCKENEVVLSFHDSVLRESDVNLLYGPYWLNDAIIGFYFEYLGQIYAKIDSRLLFISPELTQLLKLTDSQEYSIFLDPIDAKTKEFIFFPVNDCNSRNAAGGSHWSLLIFSKLNKTCYYFDSSRGMNTLVAKEFSRGIMNYLLDKNNGNFIELDCPQQENGYDCGLFVLCFADVVIDCLRETSKIENCNCDNVNRLVREKREFVLTLIGKLKKIEN